MKSLIPSVHQPDLLQLVASGHVEATAGVGEDETRDANVVVAPHCCHLFHDNHQDEPTWT